MEKMNVSIKGMSLTWIYLILFVLPTLKLITQRDFPYNILILSWFFFLLALLSWFSFYCIVYFYKKTFNFYFWSHFFMKLNRFDTLVILFWPHILLVVWKCLILCHIIVICGKCWFSSFIRRKRRLKRIESSKKFTEMLL